MSVGESEPGNGTLWSFNQPAFITEGDACFLNKPQCFESHETLSHPKHDLCMAVNVAVVNE